MVGARPLRMQWDFYPYKHTQMAAGGNRHGKRNGLG